MNPDTIIVHAKIDGKTFRRFGLFDTFILKKRWRPPALFAFIFVCFALLCFALTDKSQSAMLGAVLLMVGLLLPACYVLSFYLQLHAQAKRLCLKAPRAVYTLVFSKEGVRIMNDMRKEPEVSLPFAQLHGAWRRSKAIYHRCPPAACMIDSR